MHFSSLFCLIFLFFCYTADSQNISFESSIDEAFLKAKKENKLVFIEYYNSDCTICKSIEPLFKTKELSDFYNSHFINYKLNTKDGIKGKDSLFMIQTQLKFTGVPFFLFFDYNKNFVHYSGAKADVGYLINIGRTALLPMERTGSLQIKYESGDRSIKTLYAYSDMAQLYQNKSLVNQISKELFQAYPKEKLGTHQSFLILKNSVFSISNGFYIYWYENREKLKDLDKGSLKGKEITILENILLTSLRSDEMSEWGLDKIETVKKMILTLGLSQNPDDFLWKTESTALVRENKIIPAVQFMYKLLNNDPENIHSMCYTLQHFTQLFDTSEGGGLNEVKKVLDKLSKQEMTPEQKGDILYLELLYFKKSNNRKKVISLKKEAALFYQKHQLDTTVLNDF